MTVTIEIKGTNNVQTRHLKGLKSFAEEYRVKRLIVVSDDPLERRMGEISVIPWKQFSEQLWKGGII